MKLGHKQKALPTCWTHCPLSGDVGAKDIKDELWSKVQEEIEVGTHFNAASNLYTNSRVGVRCPFGRLRPGIIHVLFMYKLMQLITSESSGC